MLAVENIHPMSLLLVHSISHPWSISELPLVGS
ncbi:hypothetical protein NVI2019_PEGOAJLN_00112 [Providencia alcalifaciens]|nr:hypothetical protein NVI2019_PEGOAJLN_00112 [Providencia alcalifaciens]